MDPIDLSSSRVNLNGPGDWKQWISIIHKFATAQNVWKYIDPSNAEKPALSKPEEPTVQQIRPTASDLTDLTAEEFRRLEFLHTQYRTKVQTHRDQQKALSSIQQHIVKTIGNYYSTIADEHDIAKELALLKARVQPTDWAHEQEVLERYYAVLKAPNRSKIDTWITSWQRILTEAQKLDLPDIKNLRPTRQFLQAVSSINPAFTDYWINKMEDEARNKPNWQDSFPDGIKISEIFERSHKAKRATGSKAVFSTFQNEGPNQSNNGYNDGDKGSNRRSKPSCLCGKKHYYSECYYLSKAARPNGWKPNKDIEHKINQKLEDPVLKEKVNRSLERYAGQRPQEPQAVQDHQNSADVRGTAQLSILGYGQVHLRLEEGGIFILNEVAHIPAFHTNVASLDRMINKGYNWNPQTGAVTAKGKIVFHTKRINRQPVIEFNPVRPQQAPSAFSSSSEPRPEQVQEATRWHQRLGHLNPEALEQLVRHTTGARIKGPIRIDCRPCSEAKATRIISRRGPHAKAPRPFWRIYIDVFHLHESYNGKKTALLIKDEFTGMIFAYFHTEATQAALLGSLKSFESMIQRQYALGLCRIHRDNDPSLRTAYEDWIHQEGIQDEPTLHQWLQSKNRDSGYESTSSQPDVTHLKAYGCRAYPMTGKALRNTQKKDLKTEAHAETGYLVGYDSSNIFRIWIPERSEVRRVRDVTFNEKVFFDPKDHPNNPNSVSTRRQQLQLQLPQHIESDTDEEIDQIRSADETLPEIIVNTQGLQLTSSSDHTSQEPDEEPDQGHDAYDAYPSPQLTTSSAPPEPANQQLRSQRQRRPARKLLENEAQKKAGFHIYTRSFFQGREEKLHRRSLPPEPRNWKELQGHRFEPEFKEAANMEMGSHWSRGTFKPFDLETRQLDAVNAFTNSLIDEDIYVLFPDGYSRRGWILKLIRALYGLRRSPLLWQKDLSNTFKQLGLELCPEDPCVFNNTWLTAFFFTD
ncbi:Ribonuclease H superfamily [Fusarium oxysporum f. sp. vasinfectum]|nr:Ribonuclease H superfamily [Fusarium oxysporum f. sp. vasinfectum]